MKLKAVETTSGTKYINFEHIVSLQTVPGALPGDPAHTNVALSNRSYFMVKVSAEGFIEKYKINLNADINTP